MGLIRSVTRTRASMALRALMIVAQPMCSRPRSRASSGETSMMRRLAGQAQPHSAATQSCSAAGLRRSAWLTPPAYTPQ
jgi:hypothetical protein